MALPRINGEVLVVGDVMRDIIVKPHGQPNPGSDTPATIRTLPGGSGANQAAWLGALDVPVRLLARVGAADNKEQTRLFQKAGVTPILIADPQLPTGQLVTMIDPAGERSFFTDRGANVELSVADCPPDILQNVGLLHLSGYAFFSPKPRTTAQHLMKLAMAQNIPISVDPASTGFLQSVGPATFLQWTSGADFCFPNAPESALLSGSTGVDSQIASLGAHYELVVLKTGPSGAVAGNRKGIVAKCTPPPVTPVDTTGAGDAFFAGFTAAILNGAGLDRCLQRGCAAGADAVTRFGGRPSS